MSGILNKQWTIHRSRVEEIVKELHDLTIGIGASELSLMISDLRNRLNEPFMFVIVGEVKAGKSSFINALLATGKEICRVAPQPMTDTIQQILYGESETSVDINPHLKKVYQPVDILKEIAIVDTPGTNTIIEHHQEITEQFIPASDLIVFVFEAKNPYRQSAWQFFDFIHSDWRKKVIFILQQKDLLPPADLEVNEEGVRKYARERGLDAPQVFSVSAMWEQSGRESESGFGPLRTYIRENITGGQAPRLKLLNNLETVSTIGQRVQKGLEDRKAQWEADLAFRKDIGLTLEEHERIAHKQVDVLVENLLSAYDRIGSEREKMLADELTVFSLLKRSFASVFDKSASIKAWSARFSKELEAELEQELSVKLNARVADLAESIQQMARMVDLKIQNSTTILRNNHEIFSDIAEKRSNVLADLQEAFRRFLDRTENFSGREIFPGSEALSPNLLTGSGMAVIGTILMAVTNGMVFDITGGILTAVGLLFAGISTTGKRKRILRGFREEIDSGREAIQKEVAEKLHAYTGMVREKLEKNFAEFDRHLAHEEKEIQRLILAYEAIEQRIRREMEELTN